MIGSTATSNVDVMNGFVEQQVLPDGRHITGVALSPPRIMLFDNESRTWEELAPAPGIRYQHWSPDGQYVYYVTIEPASEMYRIRLADRSIERVFSLRNQRWVYGIAGLWVGLDAEGAPLFLRDTSVYHIYALDLET